MLKICTPCQREFKCVKVGATAIQLYTNSDAKMLFSCDIYACPQCGHQIAEPARAPFAQDHQPDFTEQLERARQGTVVEFY